MITSKEIKIKIPEEYSTEYIEKELDKLNFDILKWAIIDYDKEFYTINISVIE